ncbi:MAG: SPOR domain-containing protein [Ignavibacteriales bacterium]|nr:SPOR domain-containing protein [Ignavibacteriales bacterium]
MPNVNLIEEEGGEGAMQPIAAPTRKGGGGGGSKALIFLLVIVLLGGGVFALNKFGVIKLWGKKPRPVITQITEEPIVEPEYAEIDTAAMTEDTAGISFVETPPLTAGPQSSLVTGGRTVTSSKPSAGLSDMRGTYTIQVSAWRDQSTADRYVKRLEDAGYPAFVEKRKLKDGEWYTVRIGRYASMKEAKKAVDTFAYEIKTHYWIDKIRSN